MHISISPRLADGGFGFKFVVDDLFRISPSMVSHTRSYTVTFLPRHGPYLDLSDDIILVVVDVLMYLQFRFLFSPQWSRPGSD